MIGGVILAGGASRRFGGMKQTALFQGRPLLQHAVDAMSAVGRIERLVVVLGANAEVIRPRIEFGRAALTICSDWREGRSASLRAGLGAFERAPDALIICLGDQPRVSAAVIDRVIAEGLAAGAPAARASYGRRLGHPVLLRAPLVARISQLRGDGVARPLLSGCPVHAVRFSDPTVGMDVDTAEDLRSLRRAAN